MSPNRDGVRRLWTVKTNLSLDGNFLLSLFLYYPIYSFKMTICDGTELDSEGSQQI